MAIRPDRPCPECKTHDGKDRPNLIYRSCRKDYICGYCTAVYKEEDGRLIFVRYEQKSELNWSRETNLK